MRRLTGEPPFFVEMIAVVAAGLLVSTAGWAQQSEGPIRIERINWQDGDTRVDYEETDALSVDGRLLTVRTREALHGVNKGRTSPLLKACLKVTRAPLSVIVGIRNSQVALGYQGEPDCAGLGTRTAGQGNCDGLWVDASADDRIVTIQKCGNAYYEVAPSDAQGWSPGILMDRMFTTLHIHGTRFAVRLAGSSADIAVDEGAVEIGKPGDSFHVTVSAGKTFRKKVGEDGTIREIAEETRFAIRDHLTFVKKTTRSTATREKKIALGTESGVVLVSETTSTAEGVQAEIGYVPTPSAEGRADAMAKAAAGGYEPIKDADLPMIPLDQIDRLPQARLLFETALAGATGEKRLRLLVQLAHIERESGEQQKALEHLLEAGRLQNDDEQMLGELHRLYVDWKPSSRLRDAGRTYAQLQEVRRLRANRNLVEGEHLHVLGASQRAIGAFEAALAVYRDRDPRDRERAARCLVGMGDVFRSDGDQSSAIQRYREALEELKGDQAAATPSPDEGRLARETILKIANALAHTGALREAIRTFTDGETMSRGLTSLDDRYLLSAFYNGRATAYESLGDLDSAQADFGRDLELSRRIAGEQPSNDHLQRGLLITYMNMGSFWRSSRGQPDKAIESYEQAIRLAEKQVKKDADNVFWRQSWGWLLVLKGSTTGAVGAGPKNLEMIEQGLSVLEGIVEKTEGDEASRKLVAAYCAMGDVHRGLGQPNEARPFYEKAVQAAEQLANRKESATENQRVLAMALDRRGRAGADLDDAAGALADYERGRDIVRRLTERDPTNGNWGRSLAIAQYNVGDALVALKRQTDAVVSYRESIASFDRIASLGDRSGCELCKSSVFVSLGDLFLAMEDHPQAQGLYQANLTLCEGIAGSASASPDDRFALLVAIERLGSFALASGEPEKALSRFQRELEISDSLVQGEPDNPRWRKVRRIVEYKLTRAYLALRRPDEFVAWNKRYLASLESEKLGRRGANVGDRYAFTRALVDAGDDLRTLDRPVDAQGLFERSVVLTDAILREQPDRADRRAGLLIAFERLGLSLLDQGRNKEALPNFVRQVELANALAQKEPDNPSWRNSRRIATLHVAKTLVKLHAYRDASEWTLRWQAILEEEFSGADRATPDGQEKFARGMLDVGDNFRSAEHPDEARAVYERGLAVAGPLSEEQPEQAERLSILLMLVERLGLVALKQNEVESALEHFLRQIHIAEALIRVAPDQPKWREFRRIATGHVSETYASLRKKDEAADWARRWLALVEDEYLGAKGGSPTDRLQFADALVDAGDNLRQIELNAEARAAFERSVGLAEGLVKEQPDRTDRLGQLLISVERLGLVLVDQMHLDDALRQFQRQISLAEDLVRREKGDGQWTRFRRIAAGHVAEAYAKLRRPDQVKTWVERGLAFLEDEVRDIPEGSTERLTVRSNAMYWAANTLTEIADFARARDLVERNLALLEDIAKAEPTVARHRGVLIDALVQSGALALEVDDAIKALDQFQRASQVADSLVRAQPRYPLWQEAVRTIQRFVVSALVTLGRCDEAIDGGRRSVEVAERLAGPTGRNAVAGGLYLSYVTLGDACRRCGRLPDARVAFDKAKDLRAARAADEPGAVEKRYEHSVACYHAGDIACQHAILDDLFRGAPDMDWVAEDLVEAKVLLGRYDEALAQAKIALERNQEPSWRRAVLLTYQAIAAALAGERGEGARLAREAASLVSSLNGIVRWQFAGAVWTMASLDHPLADAVRGVIGTFDRGGLRPCRDDIAKSLRQFADVLRR